MSTLINRLVKQALTTFRCNEPNLAEIEKLMSLVTAEDVFFDWKRVPELSVTHPGAYMGVFDSDDATLGVFVIKENYTLPLHDHPSMHGFVKVILGKVKVRSFTRITSDFLRDNDQMFPVKFTGEVILDQGSPAALLTPSERNYHSIASVDGPAAFVDLLAPPYDYVTNQRRCHYYCEKLGDDASNPDHCYLERLRNPPDFDCLHLSYRGPTVAV